MQCRSHSRRRTSECLFVTACSMDEYAEEQRTEKNLIIRSGISEAETTNNKRLRSTFCIKAIMCFIQTRTIARPFCDSRASCLHTRVVNVSRNLAIYLKKHVVRRVPSRQTRSAASPLLSVPTLTTDFARCSFSYAAPVIWNSLPTEVMLCDSGYSFIRHLKTFLLNSCQVRTNSLLTI